MASVRITINGVICDLYGRTISGPVKIVGEAMYTDLGPGGGPIFPEPPPGGGEPPWGGVDKPPVVTHPIWPPYVPGHPLPVPPDPPGGPPGGPPTDPPNTNWQWVWVPDGSGGGRWTPGYVPPEGTGTPH